MNLMPQMKGTSLYQWLHNLYKIKRLKLDYLKKFFRYLSYPEASQANILIYAGIGHMYLTHTEILLYHLLKYAGYRVDYYIYDEHIAINEVITQKVVENGKKQFWQRSVKNATKILDAAHVNYSFISKSPEVDVLIAPLKGNYKRLLDFSFDEIDFGNIVKGVMYRYYKSINFGDDAAVVAYDFLETSLTNYSQVKTLHEKNQYKYMLFSHGIYCTWEPVAAYCKQNKIDFVCYDRAKKQGTVNFNINQPAPDWSFNKAWARNINRELSVEEEAKVDAYLSERELQKGDVYSYNPSGKVDDLSKLKEQLGIKKEARVITLFTNLIWDAANVARDIAFKSMLECIDKTVEHYKNKPDVHILVRTHPAEKILGTEIQYAHLIRERIRSFPDNFTIISGDMEVNSFTVLDLSDIGVVHTSTVGLEMAMEGNPVLLISETHYRNKGFTFDIEHEVDYFNTINSLLEKNHLLPQQVKLARKYFYMMMFEYQHKMPVQYKDGIFEKYCYADFETLRNHVDEPIVQIVEKLTHGNKFDDFFEE